MPAEFVTHALDDQHSFQTGELPTEVRVSAELFETLWEMHPQEFQEIHLHGRRVKTPRWQQAFGADYHFSGQTSRSVPVPELLQPLLDWAVREIHPALNGLLLVWYDGLQGHYIGMHRDSTKNMIAGAPIVTVSCGETRTFRLRPWRGSVIETSSPLMAASS